MWSNDTNHKYTFKSVPFAKSPLDELRFELPQRPDPWDETLDALEYSAACMSNFTNIKYPVTFVSEDCLYMNIFTSKKCLENKCPVIVYYHGGGFKMESATMFPDEFILERYVSEDVVFVIPAFRLGAFGQLYFGPNGILHENLLMFDVVHGLKFVHEEIEYFGGNPEKVTIMGHSTGAFIVNALGFSSSIDPDKIFFQQMIVLSAPGEFGFDDLAVNSSFEFAERLNCLYNNETKITLSVSEILFCMRQVDAYKLLRIQSEIIYDNERAFRSIIRGAPIMKLGGKISDFRTSTSARNVLYGTTEFEFLKMNQNRGPHASGSFLDFENPRPVIQHYYDIFPTHKDEWVELDSAGVFVTARTYCEAMVNAGGTVYLFETRQKPQSIHVTDMQYFIGIHREDNHTSDMDVLDSFYSKMLVNFTKSGVPSPSWEKLDPKRMNYLELKIDSEHNEGPKMMENYHERVFEISFYIYSTKLRMVVFTCSVLLTLFCTTNVLGFKIVTTSYGKLRGTTDLSEAKNPHYVFKNIPFAKPPIGDLRFALPQDPDPWNDIRDATQYSAACQTNFTASRRKPTKISEDCLYINIFTSERCLTNSCAVLIYYHGGGFKIESATTFPDEFLLERYVSEDVIFVLPAYRLGVFGQLYFGLNGELSENLLVHDAVKALHYVHNEISNFGGDPNRVTIMGHSSGATLVVALGFSKLVDPNRILFQQIISLSAIGEFGYYDVAVDNSLELAEKFGCISTEVRSNSSDFNVSDALKCLRQIDKNDLTKMQSEIIEEDPKNFKSIIRGSPFMELNGKIQDLKTSPPVSVFSQYTLEQKLFFRARNIVCGTTEFEFREDIFNKFATGTFLDFDNPHAVNTHYSKLRQEENLLDPFTSGVFISARTYSEAMAKVGANAFIYETRQKPKSIHVSDMQYFIGIHREKVHTPDMDVLDLFYSKMLVNFTKTGVPSPEWEKLDPKRMNYLELKVDLELNEGPKMMENYHESIMHLWFVDMMEYDRNVSQINRKKDFNNNFTVFDQWWFYIILFFAVIIILVLVACFRNCGGHKNGEELPLLVFSQRIISTSYGDLEGKTINGDQHMFKNIPFAKPPVGKLRFTLPKWPDSWKNVRNAKEYGVACLSNTTRTSVTNTLPMSEDCLYLNVFTNEHCLKSKNCSTLIYYHGGGINSGSAIQFNDTFILERYVKNDIVFIIPAYRLGVFGLLFFGDDNIVPHNLAIHDCEHALRFIHQEISHFGGHENDINLIGHSAGGHISMIFGFSRLIDPDRRLIKRVIVISPVPSYDMPELLIKNCYELAQRIGCYEPNITSDHEIVECLRLKNGHDLIAVQRIMEDDLLFFWNFLAGEPFMHLNDSIADFKKNAVRRDMMIGNTENENGFPWRDKENPAIAGSFMDFENPYEVARHWDEYHDSAPNGTVYESFTQGIFVSVATYAQAEVNTGAKVYLFQSNQKPSSHVSDMQYFVGTHREDYHTSDMDIMDTFYSEMIVNFTKYGEPSPVWEPLDPARMNYYALEVDTEKGIWPKMEEGFHESDVNFWFINMTAFDREVTRQKQLSNTTVLPRYPMYPGPVILPKNKESASFSVSSQWWFYLLIVVVALIVFCLIYVLKRKFHKRPVDETTPLFK
ncbi:unnamed protein product [Caenorhabditis brenneri]